MPDLLRFRPRLPGLPSLAVRVTVARAGAIVTVPVVRGPTRKKGPQRPGLMLSIARADNPLLLRVSDHVVEPNKSNY